MSSKSIAFVHYPHYPDSARIDTMPFVLNCLKKLSALGWMVDVLVWEKLNPEYSKLFPKNINVLYQDDKWIPVIDSILVRWSEKRYKENTYYYRYRWGKKYDCVFGLGQIGAYIAHLISKRNRAPLVLFNDEFPSCWANTGWTKLEQKAFSDSKLIVVPDPSRAVPLLQELGMPEHPYAVLPNAAELVASEIKINWHERLGIPPTMKLCLNAGSIADFALIPELMSSVPAWPGNAALVLNERNKQALRDARAKYAHLDLPGRIFWVTDSLSEGELNSLVGYCSLNFALYENSGPNIEYIGFSSGKILRSLAAGIPVIASDLKSLQFVRDRELGILVKQESEIASAVAEVLSGRIDYKTNCLDFYTKFGKFDNYWNDFCETFFKTTGLTLNS